VEVDAGDAACARTATPPTFALTVTIRVFISLLNRNPVPVPFTVTSAG
jgi:hypothetical protein